MFRVVHTRRSMTMARWEGDTLVMEIVKFIPDTAMKLGAILILSGLPLAAHDIITTPLTWTHEISGIVAKHCVSCHSPKGKAFPLLTYEDVRPWAVAIREEVLKRTMPPWGAVKGFGDFRDDNSLTPEEVELIVKWTEGGVPEGDEKPPLVPPDKKVYPPSTKGSIRISGIYRVNRPFRLAGLYPTKVPPDAEFQITAELPDGSVEPLIWLKDYRAEFSHEFWLRKPLTLPAGTTIRGVPKGSTILLLPTSP